MKTALTTGLFSLALAFPAWADPAHHPEKPAAPDPAQTVERMQQNASKMKSQLDAIAAAKTAEERNELMADHMRTMRENMMLGQQMSMGSGGCMMMGGMQGMHHMHGMHTMMGGAPMMQGGGMMMPPGGDGDMQERMRQMERRMDMMQMMMERMPKPAAK